ncbi:MAG: glycyl-tRNA synthetase beta chain [Kangiellaceae bacterium]|jgi:glycyl-tRNA synthetase beta chain
MNDLHTHTLLVELGCEELPPNSLKQLSISFAKNLSQELNKLGFTFEQCLPFGAPRRLAVAFTHCLRTQADKQVDKRGPAVSVAFNSNAQPTPAAIGWAKGNGITIDQAQRLKTDKGEWLLHKALVPGQSLDSQLQGALERTIKQLPIPKAMRWGSSNIEFIRPVHTLCVMYGNEVIDLTLLGLKSNNLVSGHRFHGQHTVILDHADNYARLMKEQYVLVDYNSRMKAIEEQLIAQSAALTLTPDYDKALLEEISSLVEWPVVLQAQFEPNFLDVPKEALIYTMKDDQKYVPLLDSNGQLSSKFLFVANIESKDPAQIIAGNEKVIRPRLSDAKFFFDTDKKTTLADKAKKLSSVLFQKELGTVAEKSARVAQITQAIGALIQASAQDMSDASRAATLAKADLVSNMVMEFPSVQGVMGYHYALHDGENENVAKAIKEQYLPRFAGDELPQSKAGMLLSLAEKLDTLVGIFGINKLPKGDKDPFALRRSAIGILRILVTFNIDVSLTEIVNKVANLFEDKLSNTKVEAQVVAFLLDRLKPFYADKNINADIVTSVLACENKQSLSDINQRVTAVAEFALTDSAESLVKANKRVANILAKNEINLNNIADINPALFVEEEERTLYSNYAVVMKNLPQLAEQSNYQEVLAQLSSLKSSLDKFFDKVMIMADDEAIKVNRIALISHIRKQFLSVADISVLNF